MTTTNMVYVGWADSPTGLVIWEKTVGGQATQTAR